ncbi:Conserved_hypothetical protein [Hexamita inflata]|uniref:RING-type domain-containing protein n=1 Tax=Hexamita inflata TaxID=28002 RepID=A0AA86R2H5_9EUKA|nr:Conserved hypothetical protein [Hexamita inflata]
MPLSTEPGQSKKLIKLMENYPIVSAKRQTANQFTVFSNQLVCEELIQKLEDISCQFVPQQVDFPEFTTDLIKKLQETQFENLLRDSKLLDFQAQSQDQLLPKAPELVVKFGELVQQMVDRAQENCANVVKHFLKQKHDVLFAFQQDQDRLQEVNAQLVQLVEYILKQREVLNSATKASLSSEQKDKQMRIMDQLEVIDKRVHQLKKELKVLELQLQMAVQISCPVCKERVSQTNLLLCLFPCGCGVCQKCFKTDPGFCQTCKMEIEEYVVDGAVQQRLADPRLNFIELIQKIYSVAEDIEIMITQVEKEWM